MRKKLASVGLVLVLLSGAAFAQPAQNLGSAPITTTPKAQDWGVAPITTTPRAVPPKAQDWGDAPSTTTPRLVPVNPRPNFAGLSTETLNQKSLEAARKGQSMGAVKGAVPNFVGVMTSH
jgi:hypothetical protein